MTIIEQVARYITGQGFPAVCGFLPQSPDRISAVFASDLRTTSDPDGARIQIITRAGRDTTTALNDAVMIAQLLDGFTGAFTVGGNYILQVQLESGPAGMQTDQNNRQEYSTNYRVWYC